MKAKFKKGSIVLTDYFSEPGVFTEFIIDDIRFQGSELYLSLTNIETNERYNFWRNGNLKFNVKKYNELFFTKSELRMKKLKQLND